ncbi:hypothetical protein QN277_011770 [Acacia crassicarpa]|uniref:Uncharacterized protein n=1 Tax=Acacia crassicarpa TaxID=499986 RepID=A0AAE1TDT4_9FABA|nr:hypothetical protein QN277_011770 [Acacia crassicarpa]
MDYERIQKPQSGGGFSPGKLRNMLMGVEKKRKDEDELDSTFTSRSHISDNDESGVVALLGFKFLFFYLTIHIG